MRLSLLAGTWLLVATATVGHDKGSLTVRVETIH